MANEGFNWRELFGLGNEDTAKKPSGKRDDNVIDITESGEDGGGIEKWKIVAGIVAAIIILIVVFSSWITKFYTDFLWFQHLEYDSVFWKVFWTKIIVSIFFMVLFFIIVYVNLLIARKITPQPVMDDTLTPIQLSVASFRATAEKWVNRIVFGALIVVSFIVGVSCAGQWERVLIFLNSSPFGKSDPIFNTDISFYVFRLPFLQYMVDWIFAALIAAAVISALAHFLYGAINFNPDDRRFAPRAKAHISVLAGLIMLVQAVRFRFDMFNLLYSERGTVIGASYTDVHAQIPALWIMLVASVVCGILFLINIKYKGWKLPAVGLATIVLVGILAGQVYPFIMQQYVVGPQEMQREKEYIGYNIQATQDAYGIQNEGVDPDIETTIFPVAFDLEAQDIANNALTIDNIRLWDPKLLLTVLQQRQALRQIYGFNDIDVDRYMVGGDYTQVMVSARELIFENLREDAKTWQNRHITYTHGYGVVATPSKDVTPEGDPIFLVKDIPPIVPEDMDFEINRPEVYYGERTTDYVFTKTGANEFDYPLGDETVNVEPYYQGEGVELGGLLRRLAFAIRFGDVSLFFSGYLKSDSLVLFNREIRTRANEIAPFISLDADPYIIVDDEGNLVWIIDGYTTTDLYPYSEMSEGFNYVRNSVKITVNAFDGRITFYLIDKEDPIAACYANIFPDLFTEFSEMPQSVRDHLRYPEGLFSAQMNIYKTYHINDPENFYKKEDLWEPSREQYAGRLQPITPYYVIMRLPNEDAEEMVLIQPFNPREKPNMIAWIAARCDFPDYGKLICYKFPAGTQVLGTQQFETLIDQQTEISQQITLWSQSGSTVIRGNTLAIPIENSILYIEPLYLLADEEAIPQLKRVIVGYDTQIVMSLTLEAALNTIFDGVSVSPDVELPPDETDIEAEPEPEVRTLLELIDEANSLFIQAEEAQRAGDWARYGEQQRKLGDVLNRMVELRSPSE